MRWRPRKEWPRLQGAWAQEAAGSAGGTGASGREASGGRTDGSEVGKSLPASLGAQDAGAETSEASGYDEEYGACGMGCRARRECICRPVAQAIACGEVAAACGAAGRGRHGPGR